MTYNNMKIAMWHQNLHQILIWLVSHPYRKILKPAGIYAKRVEQYIFYAGNTSTKYRVTQNERNQHHEEANPNAQRVQQKRTH